MTLDAEILFSEKKLKRAKGALGVITLNRPKALNALSLNMIKVLARQLRQWEKSDHIMAVIIQSLHPKAFCAGGDIRMLYEQGKFPELHPEQFFLEEYRLNYLISHYSKPYIALLNGITMGGGAGISIHGMLRLALCPSFVFAMPETGIGFFPDIGASYFLTRCSGEIGLYLGLTGARLNANEAKFYGLIDGVLDATSFDSLLEGLLDLDCWSGKDKKAILAAVEKALFPKIPPTQDSAHSSLFLQEDPHFFVAEQEKIKAEINEHFAKESVEAILESLRQSPSKFAQDTYKLLLTKSPTSLKITLRQLRQGKSLSLLDCLKQEYRLANHCLLSHDFYEGVRAVVVDKDNQATWNPAQLTGVTQERIESYFAPLRAIEEFSIVAS